jgi:hypothetical protein
MVKTPKDDDDEYSWKITSFLYFCKGKQNKSLVYRPRPRQFSAPS